MAEIRVSLQGGEQVLRELRRRDENVRKVLLQAVTAAAELVRDDARSAAPGPEVETDTVRATQTVAEVAVGPDKEHWHYRFSETGAGAHPIHGNPLLVFDGRNGVVVTPGVQHPGMAARPFLRPAMDANEGPATDEMGRRWRGAIEA